MPVRCCCCCFIQPAYALALTRASVRPAVAAGVTAVFGAPVGGVLFSIEVTMTHYRVGNLWRAFTCAVLCVSTYEALNTSQVRTVASRSQSRPSRTWGVLGCRILHAG